MRMNFAAVTLLALGMATSAFAQSNPAPTGSSMDKSSPTGAGGGASSDAPANAPAMGVAPSATNDAMGTGGNTNTSGTVDRSKCPPQPVDGAVATQGGNGGASKSEACPQAQ